MPFIDLAGDVTIIGVILLQLRTVDVEHLQFIIGGLHGYGSSFCRRISIQLVKGTWVAWFLKLICVNFPCVIPYVFPSLNPFDLPFFLPPRIQFPYCRKIYNHTGSPTENLGENTC